MSPIKQILLVEDDDIDAMALKRAVSRSIIGCKVIRANDGIEALEHLRGSSGRVALELPFIVMLDLNMPRMNGLELLKEVRGDPELDDTVIFVLSTSSSTQDLDAAYKYNIAGYIVKTDLKEGYSAVTDLLEKYWEAVSLPQ